MEAAAETVKQLTRTILPERPHQLAQSPDWKCRYPPDEPAKRPEEWHDTRLQYMTFLSDADRGVLFTRNYYDFRPEPTKHATKEASALAKGSATKKTLSLSDYKNKKTTGVSPSDPPADSTPTQASRKHADRHSAAPGSDNSRAAPDHKAPPESSTRVEGKKNTTESSATSKTKGPSENIVVDMRLPPKPPGLPPKPPTPESRKRAADGDDATRPPKRPKPTEVGRSGDDRLHTSRDDTLRRKAGDTASSRDASSHRSLNASSSLPNGRAIPKGTASSGRGASPPPRSRGDSVNGVRHSGSDNHRGAPHKMESSSKPSVPPLLSPLHLDVEGNKDDYESRKAERRYRDEGESRPARPNKNQETQKSLKRQRSPPPRLPPLLSPTLPPEVEAELERRKKDSSPSPDSRARDKDPPPQKKRAPGEPLSEAADRSRSRLVVTLKIPRRMRQEFRLLMKLSPREKPQRTERPPGGLLQAKAEKRAPAPADKSLDPSATKRPRASEASTAIKGPAVPSTPSKKGSTAMSRVSSSNSMANTPGDGVAATPTMPGSSERASHERGPLSKSSEAKIRALREREDTLRAIGRQLKHKGDLSLKPSGDHGASTNGSGRPGETNTRAGYALMVESIAAFMTSFHLQDVHRGLAGKPSDPKVWTTLFPLMDMLLKDLRRSEQRRYAPVFALTLLLQGVSHDQVLNAWTTYEDPSNSISVKNLVRHERSRKQIWTQFRDTIDNIDGTYHVKVSAWYSVEEVVESTLRILRRWCADEGVDWSAELNLREHGLKSVDKH